MSTFVTLYKSILKDIFSTYVETPYFFKNVPEKQGDLEEFVKVFVVLPNGEKENITDTDQVHFGAIMVQIFTPMNQGEIRPFEIADILKDLLVDRELDNGNLFIHGAVPIPASDPKGRYNQLNVEARFTFNYRQEV